MENQYRYTEIVDLTLPITTGMPVPPGNRKSLPPVEFRLYREAARDGIQVGYYQTGIHAGTHLDAPRHIVAGGKTIDQLPLEQFMGRGLVIDCSAVEANAPVTAAMLEAAADKIEPGMIVLLYTGWSDRYFNDGSDTYWTESPYLGEDAAAWLVAHQAKIVGFDFFQEIGAKRTEIDPSLFHVHQIILGSGCLNIEHLTGLGSLLGKDFDVIALPLKLIGAEGSPTRVAALIRTPI